MKVINYGLNKTELELNSGARVFVSYETPVAAFVPDMGYIRTATKWSRTTSKHINQWLSCRLTEAKIVPQTVLNELIDVV